MELPDPAGFAAWYDSRRAEFAGRSSEIGPSVARAVAAARRYAPDAHRRLDELFEAKYDRGGGAFTAEELPEVERLVAYADALQIELFKCLTAEREAGGLRARHGPL